MYIYLYSVEEIETNNCISSNMQFLYTLKVTDPEKAEKLTQSLPPGLRKIDI